MAEVRQPPFVLGQTVYTARAWASKGKKIPCIVCYGQKFVTVIFGNGEHQKLKCDACHDTWFEPTGTNLAYEPKSKVATGTVTGMVQHGDEWEVYVDGNRCDWNRGSRTDVFGTEDEATKAAEIMLSKEIAYRESQSESARKTRGKSLSWKVQYHKRGIADAKRQFEFHNDKLCQCEEKLEARKTKRQRSNSANAERS